MAITRERIQEQQQPLEIPSDPAYRPQHESEKDPNWEKALDTQGYSARDLAILRQGMMLGSMLTTSTLADTVGNAIAGGLATEAVEDLPDYIKQRLEPKKLAELKSRENPTELKRAVSTRFNQIGEILDTLSAIAPHIHAMPTRQYTNGRRSLDIPPRLT